MAIHKRGKWWYGDSQADITAELVRQGKINEDIPTRFADLKCQCGSTTFRLRLDDDQGAAIRTCTACGNDHPIGDSDQYIADAELEEAACVCGGENFEVTVGLALYDESDDVRWLYLGCRCPVCGLTGCYGDWTSEFPDYRDLMKRL